MSGDRTLVVIGPLPPPYHGVTVSTSLVLANAELRQHFRIKHVDTSDHRSGANIGRWDTTNILLAIRSVVSLERQLRGRRGVVYLPLSQSAGGFLRDSLFIAAARLRGWTIAAHLRGSEFTAFYLNQPLLLRRWIKYSLSQVNSVAVMGESLRHVFSGLVDEGRIVVVPNGTPEPAAAPGSHETHAILFLSNLRQRKGVVEAVLTAKLVVDEEPKTTFIFAGAWESESLADQLRSTTLGYDGISFLPAVHGPEKEALLREASILLFPPNRPEGHPRVVLEAMAAGLPVVTTAQGAIPETVEDGVSGFVLDDATPEELAERILRLVRTPDLRKRMGAAARARYLERFTQDAADRRLADWLTKVGTDPAGRVREVLRELQHDADLVEPDFRDWWRAYLSSHEPHFLNLISLVEDWAEPRCSIVDVGNFPGHFTILLSRLGYRAQGVDLKPERADRLWRKHGVLEAKADIETESVPIASASADVVVLAEVLEHLRINPFHALQECHRMLRPGGRLVLSVPNVSPRHRLRFLAGRDYQGDIVKEFESLERVGHMGHFRLFSRSEIHSMLDSVGFLVRESRVAGWLPGGRWSFVKYLGPARDQFRSHLYVVAEARQPTT